MRYQHGRRVSTRERGRLLRRETESRFANVHGFADSFFFIPGRNPLFLFLGFYTQGDNRLTLNTPGRGRDDGSNRLLAGVLPLAH